MAILLMAWHCAVSLLVRGRYLGWEVGVLIGMGLKTVARLIGSAVKSLMKSPKFASALTIALKGP